MTFDLKYTITKIFKGGQALNVVKNDQFYFLKI